MLCVFSEIVRSFAGAVYKRHFLHTVHAFILNDLSVDNFVDIFRDFA